MFLIFFFLDYGESETIVHILQLKKLSYNNMISALYFELELPILQLNNIHFTKFGILK